MPSTINTQLASPFSGQGEGGGEEAARRQGEGDGGALRPLREAPVLQHQGPRQGDQAAGHLPQGRSFSCLFTSYVVFCLLLEELSTLNSFEKGAY